MKWCFLANEAPHVVEFMGKLAHQAVQEGDQCLVLTSSTIAEYTQKKFFPREATFLSKVDWCRKHWNRHQPVEDVSWKQFFSMFDRHRDFRFDYAYTVALISQLQQFFQAVFQKEKPDIVLNEPVANIFTATAHEFSKRYGIPYVGCIASRMNGRIDLYDREHTNSRYEAAFRRLDISDISEEERSFAEQFVADFISHKQIPPAEVHERNYLRSTNPLVRYGKREMQMIAPWIRYVLRRRHVAPFDYKSEVILHYRLRYPFYALRRKVRAFLQSALFDSPNEQDRFFLFPLHMQPEASTSVMATYFSDQLNTVRNTAFALPFPYKLYVREHPSALGHNSLGFYRSLKRIPNVVCVSPREDATRIIARSQGVITLTSTMGLEAALAGKPVYVLGNVFYSYHPMCRKVRSFEELRQAIERDMQDSRPHPDLENWNLRFVVSYFRNGVPGDIVTASTGQDTNDYRVIFNDVKKLFFPHDSSHEK